jgi:hypothetical protein
LDDRGVPDQKHQTNDYGKDIGYTPIKKKKDKGTVEAFSLETQMKQTRSKKKP